MFPARAGMSRVQSECTLDSLYVPRASGDEPSELRAKLSSIECSPRERG